MSQTEHFNCRSIKSAILFSMKASVAVFFCAVSISGSFGTFFCRFFNTAVGVPEPDRTLERLA